MSLLRPNLLKALLANLPENTDDKIAALEDGLVRCNHFDVVTNALAPYRLMELYKVRKRYQEAIDQGKSIVAMKGVNARAGGRGAGRDRRLPRFPGPTG